MDLSELIAAHKEGRSYPTLARDCGDVVSSKRLQQIVTGSLNEFPEPNTIRGLAKGLHVSQAAVVLAAAESLGLDVRRPSARLLDLLPGEAADLTEEQAAYIAQSVTMMLGTSDDNELMAARRSKKHPPKGPRTKD